MTRYFSVTRVVPHASPAPPSKSHVPLSDQAVVVVRRTDMQKPSRDRSWKMAPTLRPLALLPTMPPILSRPWLYHQRYRPSLSVT
jgi:hypothetical protein